MQFKDLVFTPHHLNGLGLEIYQAKYNGYSIIYGTFIHGIEIMNPKGEVYNGLTEADVERILSPS